MKILVLNGNPSAGDTGFDSYLEQLADTLGGEQAILVASGLSTTDRVNAALDAGAGWLAKPYTGQALSRSVRALIDGMQT